MSQLNHNQGNQNSNPNNGNYHPRRNMNHRVQNSQYTYAQAYIPAEYGYPPIYASPAANYYTPSTAYYQQQYPGTPFRNENAHHQIQLTTQTGEQVDLKALNSQSLTPNSVNATLSRSAGSTPKLASPQTHQRTPSIATTPAADPKSKDVKDSFRAAVLAKIAAKKALAEGGAAVSKKEGETENKEIQKEKVEIKKTEDSITPPVKAKVESTEVEPKVEPNTESKGEVEVESKVEAEVEAVKAAEAKGDSVSDKVQEEDKNGSTETPLEEESKVSVEEKVDSEESTSSRTEVEAESKDLEVQESKEVIEPIKELKAESEATEEVSTPSSSSAVIADSTIVEESSEDGLSITTFLNRVKSAVAIKDPFKFEYPEGFVGPDPKLRENSKVPVRYDPKFLFQFGDKTKFVVDDEFKENIKFLLDNLADKGRGGGNFRGGFGQGSIQGIQGSQFSKSSSNLRKFNMDSRSNSRQSSRRKGGSGRGDRKSNRTRDRDSEREPEVPAEPVAPLEKSATRWVPKSRAAKPADEEVKYAPDGVTPLLTESEINRKTKSHLNKLTLEFFEPISDDIIAIANQSQYEEHGESLKLVLAAIFDKATDEPHWSGMYAQLCAKLCKDISPDVKDADHNKSGGHLARSLLLNRCQQEYQKGWTENLPTNEDGTPLEPEMMTDDYYRIAAAKRRGLGLVRLIGHLFVLRLLSLKVVVACLQKLTENIETPTEDIVENLIQLLKTVGAALDNSPDKESKVVMDTVFSRVHQMSETAKISSRLQFSLLDLIELRKRNWKGGEAEKGPKTISEIHDEERKRLQEEQRAKNERSKQQRGGNDSRSNSSRNSWGGSNRVSDTDIKNVGKISSPRSSSDLGPQNNFMKSRSRSNRSAVPATTAAANSENTSKVSSPLGARENSKRAPQQNSFELLNEEHDDEEEEDEEIVEEEQKPEELHNEEEEGGNNEANEETK